jgi:hypothetical protein
VANTEWGEARHLLFGRYPYRIKTYEFCSASRKFVMADQFVTKHEYALAEAGDGDGGLLNLNDLLARVDARLVRRYGAGQTGCRKKSGVKKSTRRSSRSTTERVLRSEPRKAMFGAEAEVQLSVFNRL